MRCGTMVRGRKSGRGQPQSMTLRICGGYRDRVSVMDCDCPLPLWGQGKLNRGKVGHGTEGTTDFAGRSYCKAALKSQQQQIEDEDEDENEEEIHGVDHRRA